jgi:hypothetical protein
MPLFKDMFLDSRDLNRNKFFKVLPFLKVLLGKWAADF